MASNFEFINYFDDPEEDAKKVLTKVRTHVMHDYFRREGKTHGRRVSSIKHRTSRHDCTKAQAAAPRTQYHHDIGGDDSTGLMIPVRGDRPKTKSSAISKHKDRRSDEGPQVRVETPRNVAIKPRLDPFNILPIGSDAISDDLIFWYFHRCECREMSLPWLHPINKMWQELFWSFATQNKGLFHMLLSLGESNRAIVTGEKNNVVALFHRGEAIRAITEGFSGKAECSSDSFIMLVSQQLNEALGEENYPVARAHLRAIMMLLRRRVKGHSSRIPLTGLPLSDLCWNDIRLAAVTLSNPVFPFQPNMAIYKSPDGLKNEARGKSLKTLAILTSRHHCDPRTEFMVIFNLHCISLMFDERWAPHVDLATAINPYYETIHKLCNLVARVISEGDDEAFNPTHALLFCMEMFAWSCLPTRIPMVFHSPLMFNIELALVRNLFKGFVHIERLSAFWVDEGAALESLLWILFVGSAICSNTDLGAVDIRRLQPMKPWFLNALKSITDQLQIKDIRTLEEKLKIFPWTEHFSSRWCVVFALQMGLDSAGRNLSEELQQWSPKRPVSC